MSHKVKGALLLKCLSAFCVLDSVGATAVTGLAASAPLPTCSCSEEIAALHEKIGAKEVAHTAAIDALNVANTAAIDALKVAMKQDLQAVRKYVGMTPPSTPPSPPLGVL